MMFHCSKEGSVGDATANLADASFTADTAEKTGQSERRVRRDAQRGEEIGAPPTSTAAR